MAKDDYQIKIGNSLYKIYRYEQKGRSYLKTYYIKDGKRTAISGADSSPDSLQSFKAKARRKIIEANSDTLELYELSDDKKRVLTEIARELPTLTELYTFLDWKRERASLAPVLIDDVIELFLADKLASGLSYNYTEGFRVFSERFLNGGFRGRDLNQITYMELNKWHTTEFGGLKAQSRNNARASLITIWRWAKKKRMLHATEIMPERLTQVTGKAARKDASPIVAYTPEQGAELLSLVREPFLPWVVLCGWNGLRSEEAAPKPNDDKPGLAWEDIIWGDTEDEGEPRIIVPLDVAKTGYERIIPLHPITIKYLRPLASTGAICPISPTHSHREPDRLRRLGFEWIRNGLRNSYISYRGRQLGSIAEVAIESGNSERVCKTNYLKATTKSQAEAWFEL